MGAAAEGANPPNQRVECQPLAPIGRWRIAWPATKTCFPLFSAQCEREGYVVRQNVLYRAATPCRNAGRSMSVPNAPAGWGSHSTSIPNAPSGRSYSTHSTEMLPGRPSTPAVMHAGSNPMHPVILQGPALEDKLRSFYVRYAPKKAGQVKSILAEYRDPAVLNKILRAKYGTDLNLFQCRSAGAAEKVSCDCRSPHACSLSLLPGICLPGSPLHRWRLPQHRAISANSCQQHDQM